MKRWVSASRYVFLIVTLAPAVSAYCGDINADAASRFRRLARRVVQVAPIPDQKVMRLAETLLEHSTQLRPEDPEAWLLRIETAAALDLPIDQRKQRLAGYLAAAPDDDAAQLRYVAHLVQSAQTAADRAAALERMLDAGGTRSLTAPLRGRIAFHAAMLHHERGDDPSFRRLLARALELDVTNADAATWAHGVLSQSPDANATLLMRSLLLYHGAAPADPLVHILIADLLRNHGAYRHAALWYDTGLSLSEWGAGWAEGEALRVVGDMALCLWADGAREVALELLSQLVDSPPILITLREAIERENDREKVMNLARVAMGSDHEAVIELEKTLVGTVDQTALSRLRSGEPGSVVGVICAVQLRIFGADVAPNVETTLLTRMVEQIPPDFRTIHEEPERLYALRVDCPEGEIAYAQPVRITITLTNMAQAPLSLASGRGIPTGVFLVPAARVSGGEWMTFAPQALDMGRSIALAPGDSAVVRTELDGPDFAALLDGDPLSPIEIVMVGVLNPRIGDGGEIFPGVTGLETIAPPIQRAGNDGSDASIDRAIAAMHGGGDVAHRHAAWLARMVSGLDADRDPIAARAAGELTRFWLAADTATQAFIVSHLAPTPATRSRLQRLIASAVHSEHPLVRHALLIAMTDTADAPELVSSLRHAPDGPAGQFARDLHALFSTPSTPSKESDPSP